MPTSESRQEWTFLPHVLTTGNLLSGAAALYFALQNQAPWAVGCIFLGMVLDVLDGFTAQRLGIATAFGIEYDSLADFLTFGIAPAFLAYYLVLNQLPAWGWVSSAAYITATALRLARFNVYGLQSPGEKSYFQGLPSPAAAGTLVIWVSLAGKEADMAGRAGLALLAFALAVLMISQVPFPHLQYLYRRWVPVLGHMSLFLLALVGMLLLIAPRAITAVLFTGYVLAGVSGYLWERMARAKR